MKFVIAPNAFKDCLNATQVAQAMEQGVRKVVPKAEIVLKPVADGGDGFASVLAEAMHAEKLSVSLSGPLGESVDTLVYYSQERSTLLIEVASICGLAMLNKSQRNPLLTTSRGVGEAICFAMDKQLKTVILGLGGSATNDVGVGMASALGVAFNNAQGQAVVPVGAELENIETIDLSGLDERLKKLNLIVACDVDNPLLGSNGATQVFGPQKGADTTQLKRLETGVHRFSSKLAAEIGKDVSNIPGAGAAGGLGAALLAFTNARLCSGIEVVMDAVGIDQALAGAELLITGEGKIDGQTAAGKAPLGLARRAAQAGVPCIALAGQVSDSLEALHAAGLQSVFAIAPGPMSLNQSIKTAFENLVFTTEQVIRTFISDSGIEKLTKDSEFKMIRKCLFPAAGYGTRFLPATKSMPKEILPIVNKPLIQYGVEEALESGQKQIAIITGRGKRALEDHFDISYELEHQITGTSKENQLADIRRIIDECTFSYTRQIEMKGLGHAILVGETLIGNEPFGVILADDLCVGEGEGVMSQMLKIYKKYRCSILAIQEVSPEEVHKYGVIEGRLLDEGIYMVSDMVEKPDAANAPSNLAIIGRYILTPDIFDILRQTKPGKNGELQITDALKTQAQQGMVLAYKFNGQRFDCGSMDGFVAATNHFYEKVKNSS